MSVPTETDCDVAVIGAGLSGLTAALLLSEAGLKVTVLEAANAPGGRIRSLLDSETGRHVADLGPTWVWPEYQPIAARWLARLGLKTFAQYEAGDAVIQLSKDQPVMRRPVPGQHGIRRIVGGAGAIIERLVSTLPEGSIRLAAPVTRISMLDHLVEIFFAGERPGRLRGRHVVLATPLRIAAGSIEFTPALDGFLLEQMASAPTWMASQAKAVAVFDRPFWREDSLSGRIASQIGPLIEAHDHCRHDATVHAIFGFVGWPADMRKTHRAKLQGLIRRQLVHCLGTATKDPVRIHVEDWADDEHICAPLDLVGPQAHPEVLSDVLRHTHSEGRLAIAVSEISARSPGLIEGAFDSGEQAADNIIRSAQAGACQRE